MDAADMFTDPQYVSTKGQPCKTELTILAGLIKKQCCATHTCRDLPALEDHPNFRPTSMGINHSTSRSRRTTLDLDVARVIIERLGADGQLPTLLSVSLTSKAVCSYALDALWQRMSTLTTAQMPSVRCLLPGRVI